MPGPWGAVRAFLDIHASARVLSFETQLNVGMSVAACRIRRWRRSRDYISLQARCFCFPQSESIYGNPSDRQARIPSDLTNSRLPLDGLISRHATLIEELNFVVFFSCLRLSSFRSLPVLLFSISIIYMIIFLSPGPISPKSSHYICFLTRERGGGSVIALRPSASKSL